MFLPPRWRILDRRPPLERHPASESRQHSPRPPSASPAGGLTNSESRSNRRSGPRSTPHPRRSFERPHREPDDVADHIPRRADLHLGEVWSSIEPSVAGVEKSRPRIHGTPHMGRSSDGRRSGVVSARTRSTSLRRRPWVGGSALSDLTIRSSTPISGPLQYRTGQGCANKRSNRLQGPFADWNRRVQRPKENPPSTHPTRRTKVETVTPEDRLGSRGGRESVLLTRPARRKPLTAVPPISSDSPLSKHRHLTKKVSLMPLGDRPMGQNLIRSFSRRCPSKPHAGRFGALQGMAVLPPTIPRPSGLGPVSMANHDLAD